MRWSDITTSPVFEDVRRAAVLEALARGEFAPSSTPAESHRESSGAGSRFPYGPRDLSDFATACFGASVDSSFADPAPRLIHRIVTATRHDEVIAVLRPLGCRGIADRLDYLHAICGEDDPDEPPMALDSLRELALFFVRESQLSDPEIGISPDGLLQAEWRVRGGILAMKFLPAGFIQFAAISRPAGDHPPLRLHGTLPKDDALEAVQAFTRHGTS